jgi:hypothetical protein
MRDKHRTITLTNRAPVRIVEDEWPIIAEGRCGSEAMRCNIEVRVRQHRDGRAIVYGRFSYNYSWDPPFDRLMHLRGRVGHLSDAGTDLAASFHIVGDYLRERVHDQDMHTFIAAAITDCFAHLPPTEPSTE